MQGKLKGLSPEKREQLLIKLREKHLEDAKQKNGTGEFSIPHLERSGNLLLSFAQERLWFLHQLESGVAATVYNIPAAYRLRGRLNVAALEAALNEIIRRHEVLRTRFFEENGQPFQRIADKLFLPLTVTDLPLFPGADEEAREVNRIAVAYAQEAFNLASGPLVRWRLLRLSRGGTEAQAEHILLVTLHHIVSDGWSSGVIAGEVSALYQAFLSGQPASLPVLPIQYADFAAWQRNRFSDGTRLEQQMAYWRKKLDGAPPVLDLPCRKTRPQEQTYRGRIATFKVGEGVRKGLETLAQTAGATSFMTLLSAFSLLLSRYGAGEDIVIGSPIANRSMRELEPLIGFFVNTLAFRIDLSGNPTFSALLERVKAHAFEAYSHQDIPFEKLVKELAPERNLSHTPLFQAMFVMQSAPVLHGGDDQALVIESLPVDIGVSHFDLVMYMLERDDGYFCMLEYSEELFDQAVAEGMLAHFQILLESIARNPLLDVSAYPISPDAERERIMGEWGRLPREYSYEIPVEALFEERAATMPDAPALVFGGKTLSYGEINARANRLAHYLREKGVGPDSIVGLMMARTEALPVALLGILKAGGAYLPIDPEYPQERILTMLEDSGTSLLLTQASLEISASPAQAATMATAFLKEKWTGCGREILYLDLVQDRIDTRDAANPTRAAGADSLAYVLYTSGSTGKPKGVGMTRHALSNLIHWHLDHQRFAIPARTLQFAPYTFDVSFQEVFSSWCSGGTLHLASNDLRRDVPALLDYVEQEGIERLFLPYVALQQLATVAVEHARYPGSLKDVITAGEQLRISPAIAGFFKGLGTCRFHNHYGPSETHVVTAYTLDKDTAQWPALPSIGKPLANTEIYILDPAGAPVPAGIPGELFVGGIALARGYLGQEAMTAERFIANPFQPGTRMYKTGDLALWEPDGNIKFLGRADNQVKIRGFRIEPGEVEALLETHPEVGEAVVIDVEYGAGDRRLVAYVVPGAGRDIDCTGLREFVKEKLPEYMVPSTFVAMEKLPVTSSGKVNRRQLPHPGDDETRQIRAVSLPASPIEEVLLAIWAEVLKIDGIGVMDNFFELGGHSLLATQLISRVRAAFSLDVAVRQIFDTPTVRGLARHIETCGSQGALAVPPIVRVPRDGEYPLSFAQERLWFLDRLQGKSANYNMSAAIRITGDIDEEALRRSLSEIVRRHEVFRTHFRESAGHPVAFIAPHTDFPLPEVDIGAYPPGERAAEIERRIAAEALNPFNLEEDTLLKGTLLRLPADAAEKSARILLLAMHHIVADNWSSGVFINELTQLYEAFRHHDVASGQAFISPLPELDVQYVDFACWQRQWLSGELLEVRLDYWRKQLAGVPPVLQLSPRGAESQGASPCRTESFSVNRKTADKFVKRCLQESVSLYMGLLAVYATLLFRYTGRDDILVGSPIANRHYREIEPLIGFFVNTLPLRVDLSGEPSYRDLVKRVRKMTLDAFTHQDVPFERIVREVCPDRGESRTPLVQVIFALQNAPASEFELDGGSMSLLPIPGGAAKFDLILSMSEENGNLHGVFEYDAGLFNQEEIARMTKHFCAILEHITANPDETLVDIALAENVEEQTIDEAEEFNF